jgi:putative phosphoesterase
MKIGVLSDTHDRTEITAEAVRLLIERGAELLIHCGDIESPQIVQLLAARPSHFVFGNWDKDAASLSAAIHAIGGTLHTEFGYLALEGKHIAWVHGHVRGQRRELEQLDQFDYLFYGHSHIAESHHAGRTLVLNPGALFRARPKTCALVDLKTGEVESINVAD